MDLKQVILLALGEGALAFSPLSDTGHEPMLLNLLKLPEVPQLFVMILCLSALVTLVATYHARLWQMIRHPLRSDLKWLILADAPVVLVSIFFSEVVSQFTAPAYLGVCFLVNCVVLLLGDAGSVMHDRKRKHVSVFDAMAAGLLQVLSLIPGLSRLGCAAAGGMCTGLSRRKALDFAFIMNIPLLVMRLVQDVISLNGASAEVGLSFFEGLSGAVGQAGGAVPVAVYCVVALAAGFLFVALTRLIVRRFGQKPYAIYSGALALVLIARQLLGI